MNRAGVGQGTPRAIESEVTHQITAALMELQAAAMSYGAVHSRGYGKGTRIRQLRAKAKTRLSAAAKDYHIVLLSGAVLLA